MTDPKLDDTEFAATRKQLRVLLPFLAVLMICAYAWPSLSQVNVTWDEALGDFFFGQRYFSYFTTWDAAYLDFTTDPYPTSHQPDLRMSPFRVRPWEYYPFSNTLAAATSKVLSALTDLDPLDGFHAVNLLFVALFVPVFFLFLETRLGLVAATLALAFLFGSPRLIGHLLANIKDFPLMVLFSISAITFFNAFEKGSVRGVVSAGIWVGLALATKANTLFFPLLPLFLMLFGGLPRPWRGRWHHLALAGIGAAVTACATLIATWPYLWLDPIGHLLKHFDYIWSRKGAIASDFEVPALEAIAMTTPPVFLAAFTCGLLVAGVAVIKRRDRTALFLLAWLATPLVRYLLPQSTNFDGVRHFLEIFPAMAAIAGWGVAAVLRRLLSLKEELSFATASRLKIACAIALVAPGFFSVLLSHPFHLAYWNSLAGGLSGAREAQRPQAGDYWGSSYRLGLRWLEENAVPDAYLAVPVIEHAVRLVSPTRLRSDLELLPITTPFSPRIAPERLQKTLELSRRETLYVMFVHRRDWLNPLMLDCIQRLEPEMEWTLDGEPVLSIYRYTPPAGF